jgi:uncharacterized protein
MTQCFTQEGLRAPQTPATGTRPWLLQALAIAGSLVMSVGAAVAAETPPSAAIKEGLAAIDKQNFPKAMQVFDAAFKNGEADGGFYLGRIAELGLGIPANPAAAAILYKAAAEKGSPKALNRVGLMQFRGENGVLQDYELAKTNMCKAADLGEKDAMFNCAEILNDGKHAARNTAGALKYYQQAADAGHIGALNILGLLYRDGKDVPKDPVKARGFFEKSAVKGNPVGLFELGRLEEADKNLVKAHADYNLATARNHPRGPEALQRVSALMTVADISKAQTEARNWKAAP